jgi:hypothetical protein
MKSVLLPSDTDSKIKLLKKLAKELDMKVVPKGKIKSKSTDETMLASEESLKEAWNSSEDEGWDKLYSKKK